MTDNIPVLGTLYINPAGGCNLNCRHCWVNQGDYSGDILPLKDWKNLILQAKELGCSYVKLTGGEPLLYENFVPLYGFIAENIPRVTIETNGTLQPVGLWEEFIRHKPNHVSVSIDSAYADVHDSFRRGQGSWKKTVSFARKLSQMKISNQVIMSIMDTNKDPIRKMIELVSEIGVDTLKINFIIPSGRGKSRNFFTNTDIREVLEFFDWVLYETPDWVLPSIPAAFLPVTRLKGLGYCPVRNLMGVLPDGTFALCGVAFSKKEMAWGKFPETTVRDAWLNSPVYRQIRESVPDELQGVCRLCLHRQSCSGRCVVNNMETGGSIKSPDLICQQAYEAGLFPTTRLISHDG